MKKTVAILTALILLFSLTACADKNGGESSENSMSLVISGESSEDTLSDVISETVSSDTESSAVESSSADSSQEAGNTSSSDSTTNYPVIAPLEPTNPTLTGHGYVQASGSASSSYFDDAVFIGDSVSLKLEYYDSATGSLGQAKYLTSGSLGSGNALWDISDESVHPTYQGNKILIEDGVAAIGAKKVYIMLGMNDIGLYGIEGAIDNYKTLVSRILSKSPNVQIYAQSVTPMTSTSEIAGSGLNNANIVTYNKLLLQTCEENNWYFIDVASVMHDESGYLIYDYCSDPEGMGIHFTETGCKAWVDYLYTHTAG